MAGVRGFEPRKWQIQSLLPYRLAIPQCDHAHLRYSRSESKSSISLRNLFGFEFELFRSTRTPILKHSSVLNATLNLIFLIFSTGCPCSRAYQKQKVDEAQIPLILKCHRLFIHITILPISIGFFSYRLPHQRDPGDEQTHL